MCVRNTELICAVRFYLSNFLPCLLLIGGGGIGECGGDADVEGDRDGERCTDVVTRLLTCTLFVVER